MKQDDLIPLLNELAFTGIRTHLEAVLEEYKQEQVEMICTVLKKLLMVELEYKTSRSLKYRLQLARFPSVKLLADTSQSKLVANLNISDIIKKRENILLIGGAGSAKTHLATGLAYAAIEGGYRVRFYTLSELTNYLLKAKAHNYENQFIASIKRFDMVVIDELGYVPIDNKASPSLFALFAKLYEQTSIIITTHLKFEEWGNIFGDAKATKAIIDRITHHSKIIETGNKSFRNQMPENISPAN